MPKPPFPGTPGKPAMRQPAGKAGKPVRARRRSGSAWLTFSAFVLTMLWFGTVGFYVIKAGGFTTFLESSGAAAIVAVTGLMLAPAALFWMVFAYLKRAYDIEGAIEPLMRQLSLITGQNNIAESRVRRFNDALVEQIALLKQTGELSQDTASAALDLLVRERSEIEVSQATFASQISNLVETMRAQTGALADLVEGGQQQLVTMADRTGELTEALATETTASENRIMNLLGTITARFAAHFAQLDREQQDNLSAYARLSQDMSSSLASNAATAEARLGELLGSIAGTLEEVDRITGNRLTDIESTLSNLGEREKSLRAEASIVSADVEESAAMIMEATERFKDLATASRSETQALLSSLNEQTHAIDTRADQVRSRISETQLLMSRMADELTTAAVGLSNMGEQVGDSISLRVAALSDAATALDATSFRISGQLDGQLENFEGKQSTINTLYSELLDRLGAQSASLIESAAQLTRQASDTSGDISTAVGELTRTTSESIDRYSAISEKAEAQATMVANNFNGAIEQYATTARQLNSAAAELQTLAGRCEDAIMTMDSTLTERAGMLDQVSERMAGASRTIKDDAAGLVLTLQQLTDRLETVRAAATATSDQTVLRLTDIATTAGRNLTGIEQLASGTIQKLEIASREIGAQQSLIASQVDAIQSSLGGLGDQTVSRIGNVLSEVERSSANATELVEAFLTRAQGLGPALSEQAQKATDIAVEAAQVMGDQTTLFSDRLSAEKSRWQGMIEDQAQAFAETFRELTEQMSILRDVQAELTASSANATERMMQHNTSVIELETRIVQTGRTQSEQIDNVRGEIEKISGHLQRQAQALSTVTQAALEDMRGATEAFGEQARTIGEVSRQAEGNLDAAVLRMGDAKTVVTETREDIYVMRTEIEQVLARLADQTTQLGEARSVTNESAGIVAQNAAEAIDRLELLAGTLARSVEQATLARSEATSEIDAVAERIGSQVSDLRRTMDELASKSGETVSNIGRAGTTATQALSMQLEQDLNFMKSRLGTIGEDLAILLTSAIGNASGTAETFRLQLSGNLASIEAQADATATRLENSMERMAASSRTIAEQLGRAHDQVTATDATLDQLTAHAGTMRRQLVDESEAMIVALDRVSQQLTSQLGQIRSSGATGLDDVRGEAAILQQLVADCVASLSSSAVELRDVSQSAGTYLNGFGAQLGTQVNMVREAGVELAELCRMTSGSESQLESTLGNLMGHVTRARGDLAALDLQIADQSTRLTERQQDALAVLSQTLTTLEGIASRITGASHDALSMVGEVESRYRNVAQQADDMMGSRTAQLLAAIETGAEALTRYGAATEANTGVIAGQHAQLAQLLGTLRRDSAGVEESLTSLADRVTAAGVTSASTAQQIIQRMANVTETLVHGISETTTVAETATVALRSQTEALRREAGDVAEAAAGAITRTETALGELRQQAGTVERDFTGELNAMLTALSNAQSTYVAMTGDLSRQQEEVKTMVAGIADGFASLLQSTQQTMRQLREELETTASASAGTIDQSAHAMQERTEGFSSFGERLASVVEQVGTQTARVLDDLRGVTERLEVAQTRTTSLAQEAESTMSQAATRLESQQQSLAATAEASAARLQLASQQVAAQTDHLTTHAQTAEAQVTAIGTALDDLRGRTASLRQSMAGDSDAIGIALGQAISALESAATTLESRSHQARTSVEALSGSMAGSVAQIDSATQQYREGQQAMTATAQAVLTDTARILGDFQTFRQQLSGQVSELAQHMDTLAGSADARVRQLAGSLKEVVADITAADEALGGSFDQLSSSHAGFRSDVDGASKLIAATTGQLRTATSDMLSDLDNVSDRVARTVGIAKSTLGSELSEMKTLIEAAGTLITDLGQQLEVQVTAIDGAGSTLAHVSGTVNDNTAAALSRLQTLNQRLEAAKLTASLATEQAARRVADILAEVDSDDLGSVSRAS